MKKKNLDFIKFKIFAKMKKSNDGKKMFRQLMLLYSIIIYIEEVICHALLL